jgi:Spy/CpxP family protein refolding chaperone
MPANKENIVKKAFRLMFLTLLVAVVPMAAQAAKPAQPGQNAAAQAGGSLESRMLREFESLNLSQDQKKAVAAVLQASRDEGRKLVDDTKAAQHAVRVMIFKDPANMPEIQRLHKVVTAAEDKALLHSAKVTAKIRAILTQEQLTKLENDYMAGKAKMEEHALKSRAALDAWIEQNSK